MTDIVERLQKATLYEGYGELSALPEEAADEIAALRVEVKSKNEQFQQYARKMEAALNAQAADNERLRAALEDILSYVPHGDLPLNLYDKARTALEEGMTSPDEREDCTGLEDSSTANPCGREDCEEEGRT